MTLQRCVSLHPPTNDTPSDVTLDLKMQSKEIPQACHFQSAFVTLLWITTSSTAAWSFHKLRSAWKNVFSMSSCAKLKMLTSARKSLNHTINAGPILPMSLVRTQMTWLRISHQCQKTLVVAGLVLCKRSMVKAFLPITTKTLVVILCSLRITGDVCSRARLLED